MRRHEAKQSFIFDVGFVFLASISFVAVLPLCSFSLACSWREDWVKCVGGHCVLAAIQNEKMRLAAGRLRRGWLNTC